MKNKKMERRKSSEEYELQEIYDIAYKVHQDKPYDASHDWQHHQAVYDNGVEIIRKEGLQTQVDLPVFTASALFHDLERGSKGHNLAVERMREAGFSDGFVKAVVDLINQHSFGDKQDSLAGTILWAADKIEYVSKDRFVYSVGKLPKVKIMFYKKLWRSRIEAVIKKFPTIGLPSANELFLSKFKDLKVYIESQKPEYKPWFKNLDLSMI